MEQIIDIDIAIFLWLNELHTAWLDAPIFFLSETKTWIPFYGFLIILIYRTLKKKIWIVLIAIAFLVFLTDGITSSFMKPYFQRLRPSHESNLKDDIHLVQDENGNLYKGGQYGFASSHAANTFGLAMFLWLLFHKQWKYVRLLFFWAFLVSYTRIYLGVHYPLDILAGALVGVLCAFFMAKLYFFLNSNQLQTK